MAKETHLSNTEYSHTAGAGSQRWAGGLLHVVDVAMAGCVFVVPLLLGGRTPLGQFSLTVFAVTAASAWWLRQLLLPRRYWRRSAAHLLLLAAVALIGLQLTPLPPSWMSCLSPRASEVLPLWTDNGAAGLGTWQRISLTPAETHAGLIVFLAYALVYWVSLQRIRSLEDVERLLHWIAWAAVGMSLFGLLQYLSSNGNFFWVYRHPYVLTDDVAKGAFTNRNHFAHFLALGIGPVIWWVQDGMRRYGLQGDSFARSRRVRNQAAALDMGLRFAGLAIVFAGVLLSLSRGGAVAAGLAAMTSVLVCYWAGAVRGKFALGMTAIAVLFGAFLFLGDQDSMGGRLEKVASGSIDEVDRGEGRRTIWKTTLAAIPDFPWIGAGAGSFREVYPLYLEYQSGHTIYTHAENGYLQVTLETGFIGLALVVLAILLGIFWTGRGLLRANSSRMAVAAGAAASALLASVAHSGVDFVWYVPGCMVVAMILVACACRISQFTHDEQRRQRDRFVLPRPVAWLGAPLTIGVGAWMIAGQIGPLTAEPAWTSYQRLQRSAYLNPPAIAVEKKTSFVPEDPRVVAARQKAAERQVRAMQWENERRMVAELAEVVRRDPAHTQARIALAGGYLRLFQFAQDKSVNRMPLSQIRDAAIAAKYSSRQELEEWLSRAVGDHYRYLLLSLEHAKAGVALCPLEGMGYLYLGELCFLDIEHDAGTWDFVDQALRVRPYDGTVLFHAGREARLAGRLDEALDFWVKSFAAGPIYQRQIIDWMAGRTVPSALSEEIEFILAQFQPGLETLKYMESRYAAMVEPEQMIPLLEAVARASKEEAQVDLDEKRPELASEHWLDAMSAYIKIDRFEDAAACGRQAVQCNSHSFDARYRLGFLLSDMGRYAEADEHLTWCVRAKPGHIKVKQRLTDVKRVIIDPETADTRRFRNYYPAGTAFQEASLQVPANPAATAVTPGPGQGISQTGSGSGIPVSPFNGRGTSYAAPQDPAVANPRETVPGLLYR